MKKILFVLCFALIAGMSYSQIKVHADGSSSFGDTSSAADDQIHVKAVNAQVRVTSTTGFAGLQLENNVNDWRFYITNGGDFTFRDVTNGKNIVRIDKAPAGSMRVTSNGNVGIGSANPSEKLTVNGNILATGTITPSDKTLKSDVNSFELGLDKLMQISPATYRYTGEAGITSTRQHVGVIAQEFAKIVPEAVSPYTHVEEDDDGNVLSTEEFLSVDEKVITYMLVNSIKEQQAMIEAQAEKIAQMEEVINTIGATDKTNNTNVTLAGYDLAELNQNRPNPFNGETAIDYVIPTDAQSAKISIFGQNGQMIKTLDIEHVGKGTLNITADDLPAGTYSYQLIVDNRSVKTNKMVLSK